MSPETVEFAIPAHELEQYADWTECTAFRFVSDGDEVKFQISYRPPCGACSAKGYVVQAGPGHQEARITCSACEGSGRAAC